MMLRHKVAVLGTGSIGWRHIQVIQSLGAPVIAVPMREARRKSLQMQGWTCAEKLEEAAKLGATFAVIATETARHVSDAEEALALGMSVLLEKPMASLAKDARHLPQLAIRHGVGLFIACPLRFDPGLGTVRERLKEVGAPHSVRIECRSYLPDWRPDRDYRESYSARSQDGGVLRDLIHEVDYALWLFGIPQQVFGRLKNFNRLGIQSEEMADGFWEVESGANISIGMDYLSKTAHRLLRICGDQGEIEYNVISRNLSLRKPGAPVEEITFPRTPNDIYIRQMSEFLRVGGGEAAELIATAEDGLSALAVCDAWRESAVSDRVERVIL